MLSKKLDDFFTAHPVETIAAAVGVFIVAVGVLLGSQTGWVWFSGQVLSIAGAGLAAISIAWTFSHKASESRVAGHIAVLARQLELSSSQIRKSVRRGLDDPQHPALYFAQIEQSIANVSGVIRELAKLTGETALAGCEAVKVKSLLEEFNRLLEAEPMADNAQIQPLLSSMKGNVLDLLQRLDGAAAPAASAPAAEAPAAAEPEPKPDIKPDIATERCPNCRKEVQFAIGPHPGDSATPTCEHCKQRFHAHRATNGVVFVRSRGASHATVAVTAACPVCGSRIPANIDEGQTESEVRFCFSCGAKVGIDPVSHECSLIAKKDKLRGHFDDAGIFHCDHCGEPTILLTANAQGTFGICKKDDALVVLPASRTSAA
uniref:Uncharacterized protein n=1 Tax=Rhodopseudomonas palustris (strain BisA53) TaxID=316055 RepID=Q07PY2_RHOP5